MLVPLWILAVVAALLFLREARTLLIPIALAVLISYALAPVVTWLERRRVPRLAGAGLVLLLILLAFVGAGYALRNNAKELVEAVPQALERGREMLRSRLGSAGAVLQDAGSKEPDPQQSEGGNQGTEREEQVNGSLLQRGAGAIFSLAGHLVVIFFLIYFLLIAGNHVRDRVIEVAGPDGERRRTVATIVDEINAQIQRYLLVLLVTATIVGTTTWLVLVWMGVRNAVTWGILAGV